MSDDPTLDFISNGEEAIASIIRTRSQFFSNITVLTCEAGDLNKKLIAALANLGLFLLVNLKGGPLPYVGDSKPWTVWITITENPITNRGTGPNSTGKTARMALEELAVLIDEELGIADATVEEVPDPQGREIYRVVGKINVEIKETQETP